MSSREELKQLRQEALALADGASISDEAVADWRQRTRAALERAYGGDASPVRDFARIRFDDAAIINAADRVLRDQAAARGADIGSVRIPLPPAELALRRGLREAAELLLSLTL